MSECHGFVGMIDDAVDGELSVDDIELLNRHLSGCPRCREEFGRTRTLVEALAALPTHEEPKRDLWPGIERQLGGRRRRRMSNRVLAVAAAAAAVVIAVVGLFQSRTSPAVIGAVGRTTLPGVRFGSNDSAFDGARQDYRKARDELMALIDARRDQYSPETLAVINHNLDIIDGAIADIERVIATHPEDERLDQQLRLAYSRQIDLLRWAALMPGEGQGT